MWIRKKYEQKAFLRPLNSELPKTKLLVEAVLARDMKKLVELLPHCTEREVNGTISETDKRNSVHLGLFSLSTYISQNQLTKTKNSSKKLPR